MLPMLAKKQYISKKLSQQDFETKTPFQGIKKTIHFTGPNTKPFFPIVLVLDM